MVNALNLAAVKDLFGGDKGPTPTAGKNICSTQTGTLT